MARPKNTDRRREEIADALLRLLPRRGYAGASVAAIAREAGLAPGLVHYHYAGKRQILVAAIELLGERLGARFAALGVDRRGRDAVYAWVDAHVATGHGADANAVAAWASLGAEAARDEEVRAVFTRLLDADRARLETLLAGLVHPARAADVATILVAWVEGVFRLGVGAPGFVPPGGAAALGRSLAACLLAAPEEER